MRFLSPHPGYSVQVFAPEERVEHDRTTGAAYTLKLKDPLVADFESGHGLFPHETELALESFTSVWNGLPENVNPATKIAIYDTEAHKVFKGWTDEYHDAVVARLQALATMSPSRLVAVADNWQPKPWATYDTMSPEQILETIKVIGIDPESVRLYEGENEKREDLMVTLSALANGEPVAPSVYEPPAPGSSTEVAPEIGDVVAVVKA